MNPSYQKTIILLDIDKAISDEESENSKDVACIGYSLAYGLIYSDKEVNLTISQGCGQGTSYRKNETYTIEAGKAESLEIPIYGKYIKAVIENESGDTANVEAFFALRGIE